MIDGQVRLFEDRRRLVLARSDFIVTRLDPYTEFMELSFISPDESRYALWDRAEVMVFELLALRG